MSYYDSCCNPCCCNPCCNPCQSNSCCSCNCGGSAASGTQPAFIRANGTMNDFARCTLARYDQLSYDLDTMPACSTICSSFIPSGCLCGCNRPTTLPSFPCLPNCLPNCSQGCTQNTNNCSSCAPSYLNSVNEAEQSVSTQSPVLFSTDRLASGNCIQHTAGTANFTLTCPGVYLIQYNANVEPDSDSSVTLSMGLLSGGSVIPGSESATTVANTGELGSMSASTIVTVPCGTTGTIALSNTSGETTKVTNANILITKIM